MKNKFYVKYVTPQGDIWDMRIQKKPPKVGEHVRKYMHLRGVSKPMVIVGKSNYKITDEGRIHVEATVLPHVDQKTALLFLAEFGAADYYTTENSWGLRRAEDWNLQTLGSLADLRLLTPEEIKHLDQEEREYINKLKELYIILNVESCTCKIFAHFERSLAKKLKNTDFEDLKWRGNTVVYTTSGDDDWAEIFKEMIGRYWGLSL
jgi:uncharacterized protein Smg (DUF494 family)